MLAVLVAIYLAGRESRWRRADATGERLAAANHVSCHRLDWAYGINKNDTNRKMALFVGVTVQNNSDEALHRLRVRVLAPNGSVTACGARDFIPKAGAQNLDICNLAPIPIESSYDPQRTDSPGFPILGYSWTMEWVDVKGGQWRLSNNGARLENRKGTNRRYRRARRDLPAALEPFASFDPNTTRQGSLALQHFDLEPDR
jgi:hypothetical protein